MESNPEPIKVDLNYPRVGNNPKTIRLSLVDVRAADDLLISYDFERNGWVVARDIYVEDHSDHLLGLILVAENQELVFIPDFSLKDEKGIELLYP